MKVLQVGLGHREIVAIRLRADEEETERVGAVLRNHVVGIDDVADRLAHLLAILVVDEPVAVNGLRQREAGRHEHGRPDHGVEPQDVLPDDVAVSRPHALALGIRAGSLHAQLRAADGAQVVREGVEPHVHDVLAALRHRDAPIEGVAADGQVTQRLGQTREHLILAALRLDEFRVGLDVIDQLLVVLGHAEEVRLLIALLQGHA